MIDALRRAVVAAPDDATLRLHLAELLVAADRKPEAVAEIGAVLARDPSNPQALDLMGRSLGVSRPSPPDAAQPGASQPEQGGFNWSAAEAEVHDVAAPMFVDDADAPDPSESAFEVERATLTLRDVGGMHNVKQRLEAAFLAPLRNPELRELYGKSLRGGLLLYGPPGCGKTFVARAVAGELGASFISVGLSDILDMYIGNSERNLHELFSLARREAPCVVFLDEVDALGQRRTQTRNGAIRGATNQLLTELDGVEQGNDGVFVLAATNQPWDVDPALRRPGRLDRTVLVLPPDQPARSEIFRHHLARRPVEGIDLRRLADATEGFSGADIAHVCETAAEHALLDSVRSGSPRLIAQSDLDSALRDVRPSVAGWLGVARNVVQFGDDDGTYTELRAYLKKTKRL